MRLSPLPLDEWSPEARELGDKMGSGPTGQQLNIFATLARHPKLMKRWMVFASHILSKNTLSPRDRELLILRIGWLCQAPYEWGQHVAIGLRSDITRAEIDAITRGPADPTWNDFDAALLTAADELHEAARVSDATWAKLSTRYDDEQMIDVVFTVGQYNLVSMFLNSAGVELDDGVDASPMGQATPQ